MKSIVKIGNAIVIKGMSIQEYLEFVKKIIGEDSRISKIASYKKLVEFLDRRCEENGGCDPLWDFPLDELNEREIEDYDYFFVELFDDEEPRYFETLIPIEKINIKEVL